MNAGPAGAPRNLKFPRRRVPVRVLLDNREILEGALYADVERLDGSRATLLDRLCDPLEHYLPLATTNRHVLLRRSKIVTVDLLDDDVVPPAASDVQAFRVMLDLSTGTPVRGTLFARLPPARSRLLDHLNCTGDAFVPVFAEKKTILVNASYIVSASEVPRVGPA